MSVCVQRHRQEPMGKYRHMEGYRCQHSSPGSGSGVMGGTGEEVVAVVKTACRVRSHSGKSMCMYGFIKRCIHLLLLKKT